VNPKHCIVVGDSPRDIEAGRAAGAKTVAVLTGPFSRSTLRKAAPDFMVEKVSSLSSILPQLTRSD
jgi:pyrophosphatase PpaX